MDELQPLDVRRITLSPPWTSIDSVESIGSTNSALAGAPAGTVLATDFQSAGRGRLDRSWICPPRAGLMFSVALRPRVPVSRWGWLPLMAGVALCDAVPGSALKWPNDLLVDGAKSAGILAAAGDGHVVVGMGVNVSMGADDLPPGATSLLLSGRPTDREALLQAVLGGWGSWYLTWERAGGDADACGLLAAYQQRCATLGQLVDVTGAQPRRGTAQAVDPDGRLVVDGVAVAAGDVTHVRPAEPSSQ